MLNTCLGMSACLASSQLLRQQNNCHLWAKGCNNKMKLTRVWLRGPEPSGKRKVSNKTLQNLFSVTSKTLYWGAIQISLKCGLHYVFLCVCVFFITKEKNGFWHFPVKVSGWPNFPLGVYQWGQLKTPCITESFDLVRICLPKYLLRHCLLDGCASMPRIHESSSSPK